MRLKLICCEVFLREASIAIAESPHVVFPEFTPIAAHSDSKQLRTLIQRLIDEAEGKQFDAILLGFGLCGNSTHGLEPRGVQLVIPRAHDCCTVLLGSRKAFEKHFAGNLSAEWSCLGYMERGQSYLHDTSTGRMMGLDKEYDGMVVQYGEESAKYLWETLHPKKEQEELIYISIPETEHLGHGRQFEEMAKKQGKTVRTLRGDLRLIRGLINGEWYAEEYLIVPPGMRIAGVYDWDQVVKAASRDGDGRSG
jgi:hypothetical protein